MNAFRHSNSVATAPVMKRNSSVLLGLLGTGLLLLAASHALAQSSGKPPTQLTYQGFLTDGSGVPVGNTVPVNKTLILRIYDALTGGTLKWSSQQIVTVDKGYFSALLGQGNAVGSDPFTADLSAVFTGPGASDRYLELNADGATIAPRLRFLPAPYAMLAKSATELLDPVYGTNSLSISGGNLTVGGTINGNNVNIINLGASGNITAGGKIVATGNITAGGYVGIGTTTPGAKLEIDGEYNSPPLVTLKMTTTSWGLPDIFNNFRYISTQAAVTDGSLKQFNVGAGGVSIGYGNVPIYGSSDALYVNGNVGIGTTTPGSKLDVNGNAKATSFSGSGSGLTGIPNSATTATSANTVNTIVARDGSGNSYFAGSTGIGFVQQGFYGDDGGNIATRPSSGGATFFQNYAGTRTDIFIANNGYVGMGTTTPVVKLDVRGSVARSQNDFKNGTTDSGDYADKNNGQHDGTPTGGLNVSIRSEGYVEMLGAVYYSDRRIKNSITRVDPAGALKRINQLQVSDYRMVDPGQHGRGVRTGLIAQEVQTVMPEAVHSRRDFVPDVYAYAAKLAFIATNQTLQVTMTNAHGFKAGDVVKLFDEKGQNEVKVLAVASPTNFVVGATNQTAKLFVYGKQVNDFLAVDYDRVFTVGIGAIQEVARQAQLQTEALHRSEARVADLEQKVTKLAALVGELAEMKKLLARLAEPRKDGVPAAQGAASELKAGAGR